MSDQTNEKEEKKTEFKEVKANVSSRCCQCNSPSNCGSGSHSSNTQCNQCQQNQC